MLVASSRGVDETAHSPLLLWKGNDEFPSPNQGFTLIMEHQIKLPENMSSSNIHGVAGSKATPCFIPASFILLHQRVKKCIEIRWTVSGDSLR